MNNLKKRCLTLLLSLAMIVTYMPTSMIAYAIDDPDQPEVEATAPADEVTSEEPAPAEEVASEEPAAEETAPEEVASPEEETPAEPVPAAEEPKVDEGAKAVDDVKDEFKGGELKWDKADSKYEVTVTYDANAGIPEGARLELTEFAEEDKEFKEAKEALIADEDGNSVFSQATEEEQESLGMAAVDLTIYDKNGKVIEPKDEVTVSFKLKELPEGVDAETLASSMEIQHLNESSGEIVVEKIATVDKKESREDEAIGEIEIDTKAETAEAETVITGFSTFVFTWTDDTLREHVIVHYVDINGKEIQGTQTSDVTVGTSAINFATYEGGISGHTFKEARLDGLDGPLVTGFTPSANANTLTFTNSGTEVRSVERPYNVEVFFIYKPDDDPSGGDTPSTLNAPKTDKKLQRQNDGTYDITLSISGEAESVTETTKANVIVIYDTSRSMLNEKTTTTYTESSDGMFGKVGDDYVELSNRTIWKTADGEQYTGMRYKQGTGNDYSYGIYNGDVIPVYRNPQNNNWYRTRTGYYYYTYSNPYNGTRYAGVNNSSNDTSYNLGFDVSSGQMVPITNTTALVYRSGGTNQNPVYTEYTGTRYDRTQITMSKDDIARDATKKLASKLLGMNGKDGNPNDMVEMVLIEFDSIAYRENGRNITNPGAKTTSLNTFNGWIDDITIPDAGGNRGGTNWEDALDYAGRYNFNDNDPVYIIFVSDGNPTFRTSQNSHNDRYGTVSAGGRNNVTIYGEGGSDTTNYCLDAAVVEAKDILKANKHLYTVGAFLDSNSKMANLGGEDYDASDSDKLTAAFDDIVDSITNALNIANVRISDGITALTASTFVDGDVDPSSFRYTKGGQPWSPITDGAARAEVVTDEDGNQTVQWNMGENYMLEKNVTYTVTFTVWPKQEAYDILADLNNGLVYYTYNDYKTANPSSTLTEEEAVAQGLVLDQATRDQIVKNGSTYSVKTNTSAGATYQVVSIVNGEEVGRTDGSTSIANPTEGMGLSESHLDVTKQWNDSLDPDQLNSLLTNNLKQKEDGTYYCDYSVNLEITNNHVDYVPVTITPNVTVVDGKVTASQWPTEKVYIAPGVMLSESHAREKGINPDNYTKVTYNGTTYVVLEPGHDYSVRELGGDYHFELKAKTYHPMVVDGEVMDVEFVYSGDDITGIKAMDTENTGAIVAVNELRAGVNVRKKILNSKNQEIFPENNELYYLQVSLKDKDGNAIKYSGYTEGTVKATPYYDKDKDLVGDNPVKDRQNASVNVNQDTYPIWYNIYGGAKDDLDLEGTYIPEGSQYYNRSDGMVAEDGSIIAIKAGEVIRFANVPIGTQITLKEINEVPDDVEFNKYEYKEGKATTTWTESTSQDTGYSLTAIGNQSYYFVVNNKMNTGATTDISGEKSWVTYLDDAAIVVVKLVKQVVDANGNPVLDADGNPTWEDVLDEDGKVLTDTASKNTNWEYGFENIPKYLDNGSEIVYKIVEQQVLDGNGNDITEAFTATEGEKDEDGNYDISNTPVPYSFTVTKSFSGLTGDDLKAVLRNFAVSVSYTKADGSAGTAEFKPTDAQINAGTTSYSWPVNDAHYNKEVTVTETGYDAAGYDEAPSVAVTGADKKTGSSDTVAKFDMPKATADSPVTVAFTNTYSSISKTVTKVWSDNSNATGTRLDKVTLELWRKAGENGQEEKVGEKDVTGTGNTWTSAEFSPLEQYASDGTTEYIYFAKEKGLNEDGKLPGKKGSVYTVSYNGTTVTNTLNTTDVTVTKTFSGDGFTKDLIPEGFQINAVYDGTNHPLTLKNGTPSQNGLTYTWTLPAVAYGTVIAYSEVEAGLEVAGWTRDESAKTEGTLTVSGTQNSFALTNPYTRDRGNLKVSKTVVSKLADDKNVEFTFKITLKYGNEPVSGTFSGVEFKNGEATIKLKDGGIKIIENLPTLITYTVEELAAEGFTTDPEEAATGTITKDATSEAAFTNTRDNGGLKVSKTVESDLAADKEVEFTFTVELTDKTINGTYSEVEFKDGVATIKLKDGESKIIEGLPRTVGYTVTEEDAKGFTTKATGDTGTIAEALSTAAFTNTRKTGNLDISKKVVSDLAADKDVKFEFTITLGDTTINKKYGEGDDAVEFKDGVATIKLKGGEHKTINGLPDTVSYKVEETPVAGLEPKAYNPEGNIVSGQTKEASYTNTRETGSLKVSKTVESDLATDKDVEFTFTVTLTDTSISGTYSGVEFKNGVATITLKDGGSKTIEGLPTTVGYTVKETPAEGFTPDKTSATGTITKELSEAAFKNTRDNGGLKVSKTVESDLAADKNVEFEFTVELTDKTINGTYSEVEFKNGVATIKLKGGESKVIEGLPTTVGYTVKETPVEGFTPDKTSTEGTISETLSTAAFTNTRKTGDLDISKKVVSDLAADTDAQFEFTITLGDTTINKKYGDGDDAVEFKNGVATIKLKGGENKTIKGLPDTVSYEVVETAVSGFTTESDGAKGNIEKDQTKKASFTNTRETGDFTVKKKVESDKAADKEVDFTFTVTLSDKTINGTYGDMSFNAGVATFTLKDGKSATAKGLPTTVKYTVQETPDSGFTTVPADAVNGTVTKDTTPEELFTNTRKTGDLEVTKSVTSSTEADKQKDFNFTVTLEDKTINGTYGSMTFTNGVATFTLRDGATKTATGLPISVEYTVEEEAAEGFITAKTGDTGEIGIDKSTAAFTNTRDEGGLVVSKTVVSDVTADHTKDFTFTVTLSDKTINNTYNGVKFTNGVATFTLQDGQSQTITGLPKGLKYTVEEKPDTSFDTEKSGDTGTIGSTAGNAQFTNIRKTGEVTISKTVVSKKTADADKIFTFTIKLKNGSQNLTGTYGGVAFEDGEGTISLKGGQSKTIEGLPIGTDYTVVEATAEGFKTEKTGDKGSISTTASTAAFTNTRETGDLEVKKTVKSDKDADKNEAFEFTVTLDDNKISGTFGDMTFNNGVATFTLKHGESKKATNLPTTVGYTVVEKAADGFTTEKTGDDGTISTTASTAAFTNTRETGDLEVKKTVVSDKAADKNATFKFTVTLADKTISGTYGGMTFDKGVATFTLKGGESKKATGLPTTVDYTVVEDEAAGFITEKTGDTGSISTTASTAAFTNTRETGKLKVTKTVVSDKDADKDEEFEFTVTLDDNTINGDYGKMTFTDGVATFKLKSGQSLEATDLPTTVGYKVVETKADGFTTEKTGDNGTISTTDSTAAFTNTRETGKLEVTKTVKSDKDADKNVDFEFTVTLDDKTINGKYGDMTFKEGVATFKLKGGQSIEATELPTTVGYTVVEKAADGFTTEKTGDAGSISKAGETAAFTNSREEGGLTVKKTVKSDKAADKTVEFEFTVTLDDKTISGTYGGMTFEKGVATFKLKDGESKNATGLPTTVGYTVVEKAADGFTTEKTGDSGSISTAVSTAAFTNTRETGELEVTKAVVSPQDYDSAVDFTFTVTLDDNTISGTYGDMTFEDGVATFTLKDKESKKATGLPTTVGYKVEETAYTGFTTEKTGDTGSISKTSSKAAFTNTAATTKITANKVWVDEENKDGKRPEKVTFTLTGTVAGEEEPVYSTTKEAAVAQNAEGAATATWYDLTTHYNGEKITYEVTEAEIDLYTTKVGELKEVKDAEGNVTGYTVDVTNTHTPFKTKVTVIKDWADDSDYDKQRPESITVNLLANGEQIDTQSLTKANVVEGKPNQWTYTWNDLDLYKDGTKIEYEVTENEVEGYSTTIAHSTVQTDKEDESTIEYKVNVTNTIDTVVPRAKYPILKINKKDQDGIALDGVKFHLENGEKKSADYETVDGIATIDFQDLGADGLGWLPVDEREGQSEYTFKLYETKVDGYDAAGPWDVEVKLNGDAKYEVKVKDGKNYWDRFIEWIIGNVKANENAQTEFDGKNIVFNVVNPASAHKLTITKEYSGIDPLPADFAIDVTYTKYSKTAGVVEATKTLKVADATTVDGKLTWTIEDVRYGTPVKVEELGYNIPLYEEETSVTVTPEDLDSETTATLEKTFATIASMPDNDDTVVAFTNDYEQTPPEKHVFTGGVTTNIDGKPVKAGQHLTYEITYKNTADKAVTAVITDTIPGSTEFVKANDPVPANAKFEKDGDDLKWTAQLGPEEEMKVSFEVEVKADTETVLKNKAKVVDDNNEDGVWTEEVPNSKPVKEVFKSEAPTISIDGKTVRAEDELLYKLSYTNVSDETQSVGFTDKIPENTEFVEASEGSTVATVDGKQVITWKAVDVAAGDSIEVTFKVKVKENNGVRVDNTGTAIVDGNGYDTNKTTNPVPKDPEKTVYSGSDLTKIDGQMVEAGDKLVYSIEYKNTTADDADVDIFDTVPKYTTFTGNWTADPSEGVAFSKKVGEDGRDELTWKAKVEKGKSITVTFEVEVEEATSGTEITNEGHVRESGNVYDTNETSNSKPVKDVIESPESTTSIDGKTVKPNEVLTYSITYTNPDKKNAQTVQIADKIPTYTKYKEDSASTVNGVKGELVNGSVTWADVKVAAGATITVTFQVTVDDTVSGESIDNDATVRDSNNTYTTNGVSNPTPPKKEIYTGTSTTNIDGQRVEPGQELTYSIKYTNPTDDAVAATITDTIPAHTTLVEGSITGGGTLSGKQITWLKNVPKGDSVTVTFKVKVDDDVSGQILTNESTVKYGDNEYTSNEVSNPTPPKKEVFTGGSKTNIDGKDVEPGDELTYQITFVNDKKVDGEPVDVEAIITDEIPAHTTYVPGSADATGGTFADGVITWKKTVAAGDTWTVSFKVKVDGDAAGEVLKNEAVYKEGENGKAIKTNEVVNPVTKELELRKSLASYLDHGEFVQASFSFRVTGTYEETAEDGTKTTKNFDTIVGLDFNSESDIEQTKVVTGLPSTLKDVKVEEVYSGNYDPDKTGPVSITEDGGTFKVEFSNKFTDDYEPKGGVTNKYVRGDNGYKYQGESTAGGQGN